MACEMVGDCPTTNCSYPPSETAIIVCAVDDAPLYPEASCPAREAFRAMVVKERRAAEEAITALGAELYLVDQVNEERMRNA